MSVNNLLLEPRSGSRFLTSFKCRMISKLLTISSKIYCRLVSHSSRFNALLYSFDLRSSDSHESHNWVLMDCLIFAFGASFS